MVVAAVLFSAMGVLVKFAAREFSAPELVFYRSVFGLVVLYISVRVRGQSLATPCLRLNLGRGAIGSAGIFLHFTAIGLLPLATAVTLNYTAPLFLALATILFMGERPRWQSVFAVALGFLGIVFLLHPSLDKNQLLYGLVGLGGGFCGGMAFLSTRELGLRGEPSWRVVFYFTLVATIVSGAWTLISGLHGVPLARIPLLLGIGASATLAQLAMTRAYREGHVLVVGSLSYFTVVFTGALGMLLWGEYLDWGEWLGMGLVVASGVLSVVARKAP